MINQKICILNYGSGNVMSVYNLINYLGYNCIVSNKAKDILNSSHLILPGVGSFSSSMQKINNTLPLKLLENEVLLNRNKFFLGICVGMQVLGQYGYEFKKCAGLGWIEGEVIKLQTNNSPLPHIGWNNISIKKNLSFFDNLHEINDFYFVHSYVLKPKNIENIVSITEYDQKFCSVVKKNNIFGVQFHPEKSQKAGQQLIKNFLNLK